MADELHMVTLVARLDTVDADRITLRAIAGEAAVEVMHRVRVVTRDGEEALAQLNGILQCLPVAMDLVAWREKVGEMHQSSSMLKIQAHMHIHVHGCAHTMYSALTHTS